VTRRPFRLKDLVMYASPEEQTVFGYLSILQSPEHGYFGGYLIVSPLGRPMEFHCTAPIWPSRAQEILYGPTLRSYVMGDQIAGALLSAARLTPRLVLTDQAEVVCAKRPSEMSFVLVLSRQASDNEATIATTLLGDTASRQAVQPELSTMPPWSEPFTAVGYLVRHLCAAGSRSCDIIDLLSILAKRVEIEEPFGRIHEAIREAQRIGGRAEETAQAA
jgi:hypothetical protein